LNLIFKNKQSEDKDDKDSADDDAVEGLFFFINFSAFGKFTPKFPDLQPPDIFLPPLTSIHLLFCHSPH
jgi:hypothetical protein